jgi:hypothetical protein
LPNAVKALNLQQGDDRLVVPVRQIANAVAQRGCPAR